MVHIHVAVAALLDEEAVRRLGGAGEACAHVGVQRRVQFQREARAAGNVVRERLELADELAHLLEARKVHAERHARTLLQQPLAVVPQEARACVPDLTLVGGFL